MKMLFNGSIVNRLLSRHNNYKLILEYKYNKFLFKLKGKHPHMVSLMGILMINIYLPFFTYRGIKLFELFIFKHKVIGVSLPIN